MSFVVPLVVAISLVLLTERVSAFKLNGVTFRHSHALTMRDSHAGGRSPAEKGKHAKTMYKEIKTTVNDAAKDPSFFKKGVDIDIELYCKSNSDGTQIGDCPFAQFVQMVMLRKGITFATFPTRSDEKPGFLMEKHEGKMPCLVHKGVSMTDSLAIAEFIEKTYPENGLSRVGVMTYSEVLEKTAGFFPALSVFIKNKDASADEGLYDAVSAQLDIIDEILRSTPGKYITGIEMSLADLYLLPQLFHAIVTMEHFKGREFMHYGGEPTRPALENYLERMLALPEFNDKRVYYSVDTVINGWKSARGDV